MGKPIVDFIACKRAVAGRSGPSGAGTIPFAVCITQLSRVSQLVAAFDAILRDSVISTDASIGMGSNPGTGRGCAGRLRASNRGRQRRPHFIRWGPRCRGCFALTGRFTRFVDRLGSFFESPFEGNVGSSHGSLAFFHEALELKSRFTGIG